MPFTGNEIPGFDPAQPVGKRFSVYRWRVPSPNEPQTGRGFYLASSSDRARGAGIECDARGSSFRLRLDYANEHLQSYVHYRQITGYYVDEFGECESVKPIVARLNHARGWLAGWTLGEGMASTIEYDTIYDDAKDAAMAAHSAAENYAEREREYQAKEREREREEARAGERRAQRKEDAEALELLVDRLGLSGLLVLLSEICGEKANHVRENWQDARGARPWDTMSNRLDKLADDARERGLSHIND